MPTYTVSADEVTFWQDMAALLDPDAYEWVISTGTPTSRTVPAGQHWYLVQAWNLETYGGTTPAWYHRNSDVRKEPLILSAGTEISTNSQSGASMYLCKPSLVTGSDARYTTDPRALYFERMIRLGTLEQFQAGGTVTDNSSTNAVFDNDFTDGMILHASQHDVAWIALYNTAQAGATGAMALTNEISDTDRIRFAETVIVPFKYAVFDSARFRGATQAQGAANVTYVKLPADW